MSLVDNTMIELADSYDKHCKNGKYLRDNVDLSSLEAQKLYHHYIQTICSSGAKEYFSDSFIGMDSQSITTWLAKTVFLILGYDLDILKELSNFCKNIVQTDSKSITDGICLQCANPNNLQDIYYVTQVPAITNTSSIICLAHEFIHYYCMNHNFDFHKKRYYQEILSIFAEKVAAYILETQKIQPKAGIMVNSTRLESIGWHYTVRPKDVQQVKTMVQQMPSGLFPFLDFKKIEAYDKALAESYGIGYLFADTLFEKYLSDPKQITRIQNTLHQQNSLQELLNYYGINCENKQIYDRVEDKIKQLHY